MSIELNGVKYTEFNDLYNRPDFLSPDEKAEIELEIEHMGELIERRKNLYTRNNQYRKVQRLMPKDNQEITQEILQELKDIQDFTADVDEARFSNDRLLQKAVLFSIWRIAELSKLYNSDFLTQVPEMNWRALQSRSGVPNQLTNDTLDLSAEWSFIQNDLPWIRQALQLK